MKLTYSKPVAEIEEFGLVDILTASVIGSENINDDFDVPGDDGNENVGGEDF